MFYYPQLPFKGKLRGSTVNASDNSREWLSCTTNVGVNLFLVVKNYTTYPRVLNIPIFCGSISFYFLSFFFFSFVLSFFSCGKWLWRYGLGPASSSGASFFAWQRRPRNEWLGMNRKGPWEGYGRQAKRLPDLVSFSGQKSRFLGTAQFLVFLSLGSDQF